jgi:adenylylsulfate kinase-like enzyme
VRAAVNASRPGSFIEVFVDAPLAVCEARSTSAAVIAASSPRTQYANQRHRGDAPSW